VSDFRLNMTNTSFDVVGRVEAAARSSKRF
jgi:hypothetical protein